ncbi:MAG: homoserine dehydrogenase [Pirellulales bacterium]|nr:homoserine dehydrogenase [Pirellulales bacterium]
MQSVKVAIVGLGTIGSGVARLLLQQGDRIARHAGRPVELAYVVDKDTRRERNVTLPEGLLIDDLDRVIHDPEVKAVVQVIGGVEPARSIMLRLLEGGKDIVTANKALLAECGPELFDRARQLGRSIAFEASVGGGIPIITGIGQCLSANQIESIHAILNGTSNFILTEMDQKGTEYANAVAEAQHRGYAEADPTMDVDGSDAAQKLSILAQLAFGARVNWRAIPRIGIDTVQVVDLRFARQFGYHVKLLAVAEMVPEGLELHVAPTLVRHGTPLAEVRGAYNAIRVVGDAVGKVFFHGLGAGQNPTASAVVADLIDTIVGRTAITFKNLDLWSDVREEQVSPRDPAKIPGRFYLRFHVDDCLGAMAEIAGVLGGCGISIASLIQHEAPEQGSDPKPNGGPKSNSGTVPLVIMTHNAREGDIRRAVEQIEALPFVHPGSVRLRVRD